MGPSASARRRQSVPLGKAARDAAGLLGHPGRVLRVQRHRLGLREGGHAPSPPPAGLTLITARSPGWRFRHQGQCWDYSWISRKPLTVVFGTAGLEGLSTRPVLAAST